MFNNFHDIYCDLFTEHSQAGRKLTLHETRSYRLDTKFRSQQLNNHRSVNVALIHNDDGYEITATQYM